MKVSLYFSNESVEKTLEKLFVKHKHKVIPNNGNLKHVESLDGLNAVIIHPHDKQPYYDKLVSLIEAHPQVHFVVFTMGTPEREKAIGEHPNLTYLNKLNMAEVVEVLPEYLQNKTSE